MARRFVPYDEDVIDAEFDLLQRASKSDAAKLDFCILRYEQVGRKENPSPALIESFEEGFLELRHINGEYKGRLLFYLPKSPAGTEDLVMLVVFRKQTQKTPKSIVSQATTRMKADIAKRQREEEMK